MSDTKRCAECGDDKPITEFTVARGKPHSYCRPCKAARYRQWMSANTEHIQAYRRARYRKEKDADPVAFNAARRETWRNQYAREPEKFIAKAHRSLARKAGAPGRGVTASEWVETHAAAVGLCAYCAMPRKLTLDHIEPLSRGGAHEPENIVAACNECNASKCDRQLVVWLAIRRAA